MNPVQIQMRRRDGKLGWKDVPEDVREGFGFYVRWLALIQAFDVGWTGIRFPLEGLPIAMECRIFTAPEKIVDLGERWAMCFDLEAGTAETP